MANQILQESNNASDKSEENQINVQEKTMLSCVIRENYGYLLNIANERS